MNPLHLSGYGVKVRVQNMRSRSDLVIADGRDNFRQTPQSYHFGPRKIYYDSVIIDGHSGYISLQALHWLSRNKVPAFVLNFDGSLISSILPPRPVKADIRAAQLQALANEKKRFRIALELVKVKTQRNLQVLDWLGQRYDLRGRGPKRNMKQGPYLRPTRSTILGLWKDASLNGIGRLSSPSFPNPSTLRQE